jgi:hypothetical protein
MVCTLPIVPLDFKKQNIVLSAIIIEPDALVCQDMRAVQKVSIHFEYLENQLRDLDVTWQPVRGDLTVHP